MRRRYGESFDERAGRYAKDKFEKLDREYAGPRRYALWVHAVSVGEVQAAYPLIRQARADGYGGPIVVSTVTPTGKEMACRMVAGDMDLHVYYPWDTTSAVESAIAHIRPWGYVAMETEIWPNMLFCLGRAGIKAYLANGRISDRTWRRLQKPFGRSLLGVLDLFAEFHVRAEQDRDRLLALGISGEKIFLTGDTKVDAIVMRKRRADTGPLGELLEIPHAKERADRGVFVFIAGSTHDGEDEGVLSAFEEVRREFSGSRLILVPRHPERAPEILRRLPAPLQGVLLSSLERRDACGEKVNFSPGSVLIVDRIGVLFELYGLSDAAFIGGSWVPKGGQNILEPTVWGIPTFYGPDMGDFAEATERMTQLGVAVRANDARALGAGWMRVARGEFSPNACVGEDFARHAGAAERTWERLKREWKRFEHAHAS